MLSTFASRVRSVVSEHRAMRAAIEPLKEQIRQSIQEMELDPELSNTENLGILYMKLGTAGRPLAALSVAWVLSCCAVTDYAAGLILSDHMPVAEDEALQ